MSSNWTLKNEEVRDPTIQVLKLPQGVPLGLQLEADAFNSSGSVRPYTSRVVRFVDGGPQDPGWARQCGQIQPGDWILQVDVVSTFTVSSSVEEEDAAMSDRPWTVLHSARHHEAILQVLRQLTPPPGTERFLTVKSLAKTLLLQEAEVSSSIQTENYETEDHEIQASKIDIHRGDFFLKDDHASKRGENTESSTTHVSISSMSQLPLALQVRELSNHDSQINGYIKDHTKRSWVPSPLSVKSKRLSPSHSISSDRKWNALICKPIKYHIILLESLDSRWVELYLRASTLPSEMSPQVPTNEPTLPLSLQVIFVEAKVKSKPLKNSIVDKIICFPTKTHRFPRSNAEKTTSFSLLKPTIGGPAAILEEYQSVLQWDPRFFLICSNHDSTPTLSTIVENTNTEDSQYNCLHQQFNGNAVTSEMKSSFLESSSTDEQVEGTEPQSTSTEDNKTAGFAEQDNTHVLRGEMKSTSTANEQTCTLLRKENEDTILSEISPSTLASSSTIGQVQDTEPQLAITEDNQSTGLLQQDCSFTVLGEMKSTTLESSSTVQQVEDAELQWTSVEGNQTSNLLQHENTNLVSSRTKSSTLDTSCTEQVEGTGQEEKCAEDQQNLCLLETDCKSAVLKEMEPIALESSAPEQVEDAEPESANTEDNQIERLHQQRIADTVLSEMKSTTMEPSSTDQQFESNSTDNKFHDTAPSINNTQTNNNFPQSMLTERNHDSGDLLNAATSPTPTSNDLLRKAKAKHQLSMARLRARKLRETQKKSPATNINKGTNSVDGDVEEMPQQTLSSTHAATKQPPTTPPNLTSSAQITKKKTPNSLPSAAALIDFSSFSQEHVWVFEPGPVGMQLEPPTQPSETTLYPAKIIRFVDGGPRDPGQARACGKIRPGDFVVRVEAEGIVGTTYCTILHLLQKSWTYRKVMFRSAWDSVAAVAASTSLISSPLPSNTNDPAKDPRSNSLQHHTASSTRQSALKDFRPYPYEWTPLPYDWVRHRGPMPPSTPEEQRALDEIYLLEAELILEEAEERKKKLQLREEEAQLAHRDPHWNFENVLLGAVALTAESVVGCLRKQRHLDGDNDSDVEYLEEDDNLTPLKTRTSSKKKEE